MGYGRVAILRVVYVIIVAMVRLHQLGSALFCLCALSLSLPLALRLALSLSVFGVGLSAVGRVGIMPHSSLLVWGITYLGTARPYSAHTWLS